VKFLTFLILFLPAIPCFAQATHANWTGHYTPCDRHSDLLDHGHLDIAVRISTTNDALAEQFQNALEFWSSVVDLDWHEVNSEDCSMQLVDGTPALFDWCICMSARSQLPDREDFQGWIAFNPRFKLSKEEMFLDSVHEIGHVLGLAHNPDDSSVMFSFGVEKSAWLDVADLDALALRHVLRPGISGVHGKTHVPVKLPIRVADRGRRTISSTP
jgi:hypothetical protein